MTAPGRLVELAHACCAGQATAPRELEPILNTELLRGAELHPVACSAGQFCWGACGLRSATQARARPWGPGRHEGGCQLSAGGRDRRLWPRVCLQEQCLGPGRIPSVQARGRPRTRGARAFASCPLPDPGATQCMQCAVMAHEQPDCDALYCASRAVLACFMYRFHPPQHPTRPQTRRVPPDLSGRTLTTRRCCLQPSMHDLQGAACMLENCPCCVACAPGRTRWRMSPLPRPALQAGSAEPRRQSGC